MVKTILNSLKYNQEKVKTNIILKILYYILAITYHDYFIVPLPCKVGGWTNFTLLLIIKLLKELMP